MIKSDNKGYFGRLPTKGLLWAKPYILFLL
jgi:hypothetical protein